MLDPVVARQFAGYVDRLVETLAGAPAGARVGDIAPMDDDQSAAVIAAGRTPAKSEAVAAPLHELFREMAAARSDAPALTDPDRTLSYAELDALSVAGALRDRGGWRRGTGSVCASPVRPIW
ncbi:hypothetical protein [Streptomyces sp. NPDC058653]|uniref:hypothetical protein n=1 Tax=Streptomyces sp. NPDC058653 TaxID=3346576 RepID=UPI003654159F